MIYLLQGRLMQFANPATYDRFRAAATSFDGPRRAARAAKALSSVGGKVDRQSAETGKRAGPGNLLERSE